MGAADPGEAAADPAEVATTPIPGAERRNPAGAATSPPDAAPVPAHRPGLVMRLVHFLQGSSRELQRVQWPDRRQVMQATEIVIGFVIVAGVYLGLADWVAGKVVPFILK